MSHAARALSAFAVVAAAVVAADPGGDPPILPPAAAAKGTTRVRVPLRHGDDGKVLQMTVLVPKGGKKGEYEEATAAVASGVGFGLVTTGKLKAWGYTAAAGKLFTLPELVLPAGQIDPKPGGNAAVRARVTGLKFRVIEGAPDGKDGVLGTDFVLHYADVAKTPTADFRLSFADRLFDLNVPAAHVAPADPPAAGPDPPARPEPAGPALVAFAAAVTNRHTGPAFAGVAVNGVEVARGMSGKSEPLTMLLSTAHFTRPGLVLTRGMAYAVGLDAAVAQEGKAGTAADRKAEFVPATLKELRFAVKAGPGMAAKDVVLTDVPVMVEKGTSEPLLYAGPHFFQEYFRDAVYAGSPTGGTFHARVKADRLLDPKPAPKPKKP